MNERTETVILIHGLWMHGVVLLPYQRWLRAEGFAARRFSCPSRRVGLDDNVRLLSRFVGETQGAVIHLVAHSLGRVISGLARPNDGLVAVEETRLAAARDSIALNVSHSGMLASRNCAGQIASFLRTGSFVHV